MEDYCSLSQQFMFRLLKQFLMELQDTPNFSSVISLLANALVPRITPSSHSVRLVAETSLSELCVMYLDGTADVYPADMPNAIPELVSIYRVRTAVIDWHMAVAEHEIGFFSEIQSLFNSFDCTRNTRRLPEEVYISYIHFITSPNFRLISTLIEFNLPSIELPLLQLFTHAGAHRILLKLCIFEEASSCPDSAEVMRSDRLHVRILLEFARRQLAPLRPQIGALKKLLFTWPAKHDTVQGFVGAVVELVSSFPSSVHFICRCLYEVYTFLNHNPAFGRSAVFHFIVVRLLFPMMAQSFPGDPQPLESFPALFAAVFLDEQQIEPEIASACADLREDIDAFFYFAIKSVESTDVLDRPSFDEATWAIDEIRTACAPIDRQLAYAPRRAVPLFAVWLKSVVGEWDQISDRQIALGPKGGKS
jgi:hypothetical protein